MRRLFLLALLLCAGMYAAEESIINLSKTNPLQNNAPWDWYPSKHAAYSPMPKMEYLDEDGKRIMKISEVAGAEGFRFDNYKKRPALKGDKIILTAEVKGKGEGTFVVQAYSEAKWVGHIGVKHFPVPETWQRVKVEFDIIDLGETTPTTSVLCHFGGRKGSEISIRDIAFERIAEIAGAARFPNIWDAFLGVPPTYVPTAQELTSLPESLAGIKSKKVQFVGGEHDFKADFGGKPGPGEYGSGHCVWLYGVVHADAEEEYTIGAGADWWMQVNVNGVSVIDTLENGNVVHPPRITDYKTIVKLKKGANLLAVKYITGSGSAKLAMGGPNELRALTHKYRIVEELWSDDFENSKIPRQGNPEIVLGEYSTALVGATHQGLYQAKPALTFAPAGKEFSMPKIASGRSFALAFRLIQFKENHGAVAFRFHNPKSQEQFELRLLQKSNEASIKVSAVENGKVLANWDYPASLIPMDVLLTADGKGDFRLAIETLVDSSVKYFAGKSSFFENLNDNTFTVDANLTAADGKSAALLLDNWSYGYAAPDVIQKSIPMDIHVDPNFDPVKAGWKLVLEDDFNGKDLDLTKWYRHPNSTPIQFNNGVLEIRMERNQAPDGKVTYKGAGFSSKESYTYGYFEARVRFRHHPAWVTAFWLYGGQTGNSYLDGMEVDIYEDYYVTRENPLLDFNFHGFVGRIMKSWNYVAKIPGSLDDFHTIACKWTPMEITYYMDGKAIKSTANHSPHKTITYDALNHRNGFAPLHLCFYGKPWQTYLRTIPNGDVGEFNDVFMVDRVRVYAYDASKDPTVQLVNPDHKLYVNPGEKFQIEAKVTPNKTTGSPIKSVYLFDSGCLIDYKDKPPYTFTVSIDDKYYSGTNFMRTGRSREKPNLYNVLHAYAIFAQDAQGNTSHSEVVMKMTPPDKKSTPYQGKAQVIPGVVNTSFYDEGGNGVGYLDDNVNVNAKVGFRPNEGVDTTGSGIGHVLTSEWVKMTVDIQQAGKYTVALKHGAPNGYGGKMLMTLDDETVLGTFNCPNNGGDHWGGQVATLNHIQLPAGRHVIKLIAIGAFNFSDLIFTLE